jgi:hypothetical protein
MVKLQQEPKVAMLRKKFRAGEVTQAVVTCLPSMYKALGLISSTTKRKKDQIHKFKIKTQILQPI